VHPLMEEKAMGGMVYEWTSESLGLSSGTYFLNMTVNDKPFTKQFIILER
jgi:hypothetical protein